MGNISLECNAPNNTRPLLTIISGPSGVGKDAILNRMKKRNFPHEYITTLTTRQKRANEKDRVDYRFVSIDEFQEIKNSNGFLESAEVYGNWYGVPRQPVKDALLQGKDTFIKVDVQGAATIKRILPEAVFVFIAPPNIDELSKRLTQRSSETSSDLKLRLTRAEQEMTQVCQFDYIIVNQYNAIDLAVEQIQAILTAEKCRVKPRYLVL